MSLPRGVVTPIAHLFRTFSSRSAHSSPNNHKTLHIFLGAIASSIKRLDLSRDPRKTLHRVSQHRFTLANTLPLSFMLLCAIYSLYIMTTPPFPLKLGIPLAYIAAVLLPITSQFVWPATPIFTWLITYFSARFIPSSQRPAIHVALLPALESVLYGANISDLQTRYTNALLDVLAWVPYGVLHFTLPFVVAVILWSMGPRGAVQFWGLAFGWMNVLGVVCQLLFPAAPPWYEIIHGLTPANYTMAGSPGGLMRIDRVFHSSGYTNAFGSAPLVFGAFPSLHSGSAVMEALFLSHFFPSLKAFYWGYVGILWWATMYLSHHYLIDLTGGACLSVLVFYLCMPEGFKDVDQIQWDKVEGDGYEMIGGPVIGTGPDVDLDEEIRKLEQGGEENVADEESRIEASGSGNSNEGNENGNTKQPRSKPVLNKQRSVIWGETKALGESVQAQRDSA
nr:inositolphosphorylceramide synthase [Cryptococcus depauperatus CBS 7855]